MRLKRSLAAVVARVGFLLIEYSTRSEARTRRNVSVVPEPPFLNILLENQVKSLLQRGYHDQRSLNNDAGRGLSHSLTLKFSKT